jgi:hypothetical protein
VRTLAIAFAAVLFGVTPQQRLQDAKARWAKSGVATYSYRVEVTCSNCALPPPGTIHVVGGKPKNAPENLRPYDTVPKLLAMIQKGLGHHTYKVTASYSATLGYPKTVTIRQGGRVVDDTMGFVVTRFHKG